MPIDFASQEASASGVISRRAGTNMHLFLEQVAAFLDTLQANPGAVIALNLPQGGQTTLAGGVSPFIPATLTPGCAIVAQLRDIHGTIQGEGGVSAIEGDRVYADIGAGGGFILTNIDRKQNLDAACDGTYDWTVVTP